jgi:hypothetical protein
MSTRTRRRPSAPWSGATCIPTIPVRCMGSASCSTATGHRAGRPQRREGRRAVRRLRRRGDRRAAVGIVKEGFIGGHLTFVPPRSVPMAYRWRSPTSRSGTPNIEQHGEELSQADKSVHYHHYELNTAAQHAEWTPTRPPLTRHHQARRTRPGAHARPCCATGPRVPGFVTMHRGESQRERRVISLGERRDRAIYPSDSISSSCSVRSRAMSRSRSRV